MNRKISVVKNLILLLLIIALCCCFVGCIAEGDLAIQQGASLFQKKKFEEASKYFKLALNQECSYDKDTIYIYISNCYSQMGDYDEAISWRKQALDLGQDYNNYLNLGMLYRLKMEDQTAEEMFKKSISLMPENAPAYASLGALYLTHNRIEEAVEMLEESLFYNDKNGIVHADLAVCYARLGRELEAEEEFHWAQNYKCENLDKFRSELDSLLYSES